MFRTSRGEIMIFKLLILSLIFMSISGCNSTQSQGVIIIDLKSEFDEVAHLNGLKKTGDNIIEGSAFMRQSGGGVVTCAGETVYLMPATGYAKERIKYLYGSVEGGRLVSIASRPEFRPNHPTYHSDRLNTQCDAQGEFVFNNIQDGEYYVLTQVVWVVANATQGSALSKLVRLKNGVVHRVVVFN